MDEKKKYHEKRVAKHKKEIEQLSEGTKFVEIGVGEKVKELEATKKFYENAVETHKNQEVLSSEIRKKMKECEKIVMIAELKEGIEPKTDGITYTDMDLLDFELRLSKGIMPKIAKAIEAHRKQMELFPIQRENTAKRLKEAEANYSKALGELEELKKEGKPPQEIWAKQEIVDDRESRVCMAKKEVELDNDGFTKRYEEYLEYLEGQKKEIEVVRSEMLKKREEGKAWEKWHDGNSRGKKQDDKDGKITAAVKEMQGHLRTLRNHLKSKWLVKQREIEVFLMKREVEEVELGKKVFTDMVEEEQRLFELHSKELEKCK